MTTAVLVITTVAGASLCPLTMWWSARRGRAVACCPPARHGHRMPTVQHLRDRHAELDATIDEHHSGGPASLAPRPPRIPKAN